MIWTALVPVKASEASKSRLASAFDPAERRTLSEQLYRHVLDCILESGIARDVMALVPKGSPTADGPHIRVQQEDDLNAELERLRLSCPTAFMVINADLPLLTAADVGLLADAACERGAAVAPDRHGAGTNAVALLPQARFAFSFGPGSLALHLASAGQARLVDRVGLTHDLDTVADLQAIAECRLPLPPYLARLLDARALKGVRAAPAAGE